MYCLEISNLYKKYTDVHAVNGISFKVKEGLCFGILGSNGAGKSTTIEILEGIKNPTSGQILYQGKPRDYKYKEKIGIQFQSTALQSYMTVREALTTFAALYEKACDIAGIIKICELTDILDRDHKHLSGGQRKRLLIGLSLINNPELIFLDEPTTGLDPAARRMFWNLIKNIKKQGKTIILTTHYMDEAYALCDEIIIIEKGHIVEEGHPRDLLLKYFQGTRLVLPLEYKKQLNTQLKYKEVDHLIEIQTTNVQDLINDLIARNVPIEDIEVRPYRLDDLFLRLTGKIVKTDIED